MTPSGFTYSLTVGAEIARLVLNAGPGACVTKQGQTCNLVLGAVIRAWIAIPLCAHSSVFG